MKSFPRFNSVGLDALDLCASPLLQGMIDSWSPRGHPLKLEHHIPSTTDGYLERVSIKACRKARDRTKGHMVTNVPLLLFLPAEAVELLMANPALQSTVFSSISGATPSSSIPRLLPRWLRYAPLLLPPEALDWMQAVAILTMAQFWSTYSPNIRGYYSDLRFWREIPITSPWSHCGTFLVKLFRSAFTPYFILLMDFVPMPTHPSWSRTDAFMAQAWPSWVPVHSSSLEGLQA